MPPKPPVRLPRKAPRAPPPPKPRFQPSPSQTSRQPPAPQPSRRDPFSSPLYFFRRPIGAAAATAFFTFATALFFRDHFLTLDTVRGSSMAPTLSPLAHETGVHDRILIARNTRRGRDICRGDVITFWKPHRANEISIKRVVAVEGDTVYPQRGYACDGEVVARRRVEGWDGLGVKDEDAVDGGGVEVGRVVVPRGHVWVEGDNAEKSFDSRDFGPVSLGLVDGRAAWVWRDWWRLQPVGDERRKGEGSRVVNGRGRVDGIWDRYLDDA